MIQRQAQRKRQEDKEIDAQKAKLEAEEEASKLDAEKKREKRRLRRQRKKDREKGEVEQPQVDLATTLAELRKEMGGPLFDKQENMKLKREQRKQRNLCRQSDQQDFEKHVKKTQEQQLTTKVSAKWSKIQDNLVDDGEKRSDWMHPLEDNMDADENQPKMSFEMGETPGESFENTKGNELTMTESKKSKKQHKVFKKLEMEPPSNSGCETGEDDDELTSLGPTLGN